jgi:hypothetical protein
MPYSDFSLEKVKRTFELTTSETVALFGDIPELECSALLTETLRCTFSRCQQQRKSAL